jgi:hypothetical protein
MGREGAAPRPAVAWKCCSGVSVGRRVRRAARAPDIDNASVDFHADTDGGAVGPRLRGQLAPGVKICVAERECVSG